MKKTILREVSKEIIVIDMRVHQQMTGLCVTNAEHCESFSQKPKVGNLVSKENLPTLENNKGLGSHNQNADSLLKINKEPGLVEKSYD